MSVHVCQQPYSPLNIKLVECGAYVSRLTRSLSHEVMDLQAELEWLVCVQAMNCLEHF